jgi:uncharacterized lipoprotein YehR (DUF1307 family)
MKKLSIMLVLAMALAFTFTSCKNKEKCWAVNVEFYGENSGGTYYAWGSEEEIQAIVDELEDDARSYDFDFEAKIKEADKSEGDCNN